MTEEEKEAIKLLKKVSSAKYSSDYEIALYEFGEYSKTILNLIEKQDNRIKELEEVAKYWRKELERVLTERNLIN